MPPQKLNPPFCFGVGLAQGMMLIKSRRGSFIGNLGDRSSNYLRISTLVGNVILMMNDHIIHAKLTPFSVSSAPKSSAIQFMHRSRSTTSLDCT